MAAPRGHLFKDCFRGHHRRRELNTRRMYAHVCFLYTNRMQLVPSRECPPQAQQSGV